MNMAAIIVKGELAGDGRALVAAPPVHRRTFQR